ERRFPNRLMALALVTRILFQRKPMLSRFGNRRSGPAGMKYPASAVSRAPQTRYRKKDQKRVARSEIPAIFWPLRYPALAA
ncbi:MAG: hypothetical protein ABSD29_22335, partial [Verrucomicrobiota bacterium]